MEDDETFFSQNSFALLYVKEYKFNTYRKNRRVSSIISRMVHYPAATVVTFLMLSHVAIPKPERS